MRRRIRNYEDVRELLQNVSGPRNLTKAADADKMLASFQALRQYIKLNLQLVSLCSILHAFSRNKCDKFWFHASDKARGEYIG